MKIVSDKWLKHIGKVIKRYECQKKLIDETKSEFEKWKKYVR